MQARQQALNLVGFNVKENPMLVSNEESPYGEDIGKDTILSPLEGKQPENFISPEF